MPDTQKYIIQNLNYPAPYPGNLMRSIWDLEQRCKDENIEFVYCFPDSTRQIPWIQKMSEQGYRVFFKPSKVTPSFWRKIIKEYRPIAVHTHFWNIRDAITLRAAKLFSSKINLILHHHNTYFKSKKRWKELLKRMVIRSDIHIACGVSVGDNLNKLGFNHVITVENAIDFSRLDTYEYLNRKDFDISDDASIFLILGHDMHRKGVDIAMKAMKARAEEKKVVLCIVFTNTLDKVKQYIYREFGEIPEWVKFLPPRDDIATYYHFADVFLSPSREEGFCYALPEAVYSGCQIIFSDIAGQIHALDIPDCISFESENVESLQSQIEIALKHKKSNTAKAFVCNRYNLATWSEKIADVYRNL